MYEVLCAALFRIAPGFDVRCVDAIEGTKLRGDRQKGVDRRYCLRYFIPRMRKDENSVPVI
jgi:hypothetical protein